MPVTGSTLAPTVRPRRREFLDATVLRPTVLLIAFGLSCALIAWLRIPAVARDTFWAEDGRTFVSSAALGGVDVLFQPYAGYLHTVPRLVSAVVVLLPVGWWALATTAAACLIAGGLAVVVFVCTRHLVPWLPARVVIAALTVLAPYAPREVLGNLANLHSLFLWALFWIVLSRPRSVRTAAALAVVALLGALTEIQSLFLAPLLLLPSRDKRVWMVRAGLITGMVAQLVVTLGWPRAQNTNPAVAPLSLAYGYLINVADPLVVPQRQLGQVLVASGPAVGIAVLVVIAAATVYVAVRGTAAQRLLVGAALCGSVLIYSAGVLANPNGFYDYAQLTPAQLSSAWIARYGVVPSMLLALVLPVAAAIAFRRRDRRRVLSWSIVAVAGLSVVLIAAQFGPQWTRRSGGPAWQAQLASATIECRRDDERQFVNLTETLHWKVTVPCVDLAGARDGDR